MGLIGALQRAQRLLATPSLSISAKWLLLWFVIGEQRLPTRIRSSLSKRRRVLSLRIGNGLVFLDPRDRPDFFTFAEIYWGHHYDANYQEVAVIDVGAHKGYFAAYALLHGAAAVFAFEPEERNFDTLEKSAETFRASGCQLFCFRQAIAAQDGELNLHVADASWSHSMYRRPGVQIVKIVKVAACAFQRALIEARNFVGSERRILVKMNVEGAEGSIILNTPIQFLSEIDELFVKVHAFAPYTRTELLERLRLAGLDSASEDISKGIHVKRAR